MISVAKIMYPMDARYEVMMTKFSGFLEFMEINNMSFKVN